MEFGDHEVYTLTLGLRLKSRPENFSYQLISANNVKTIEIYLTIFRIIINKLLYYNLVKHFLKIIFNMLHQISEHG